MQLVVKQNDRTINEFRFTESPVSIGRAANNQICLPDITVSKQHAQIFTADGKWLVQDMDSANKTYLNNEAINKAEIKTGDCLYIADFIIEIDLKGDTDTDEATPMEDTLHLEAALTTPPHEIVVRKTDAGHAPAMRLPAQRLTDFSQATVTICEADSFDKLLLTLLNITFKQFGAYHAWCALRSQPAGPMTHHSGKSRDGQTVELGQLKLNDKINQVVEKGQFLVLPRVSAQLEEEIRIRSALIAAIMRPNGCYGVLYVDNAMRDKHYSLSDLDYLMLLSMHTAAILRKFEISA